jgi:hypothetical protein
MELKEGDRVKFTGCSPEQVQWGGNADPNRHGLLVGTEGTIERVEVHSWHTKVWIRVADYVTTDGPLLGPYNSVCFEETYA